MASGIPIGDDTAAPPVGGIDPEIHIAAIRRLLDSGATLVNIHSGQADQKKVIDFYGRHVLPHLSDDIRFAETAGS